MVSTIFDLFSVLFVNYSYAFASVDEDDDEYYDDEDDDYSGSKYDDYEDGDEEDWDDDDEEDE